MITEHYIQEHNTVAYKACNMPIEIYRYNFNTKPITTACVHYTITKGVKFDFDYIIHVN